MAGCSQPGTSTQTTVMSAGPPAAVDGLGQPQRAAGVGDDDLVGQSRCRAAGRPRARTATTPMRRPAPASAAAASESEPDLPAPPRTHTVGATPRAAYSPTTRATRAGAPQTSMTMRARSGLRSSGSRAAMDRPKRIAWPWAGTRSERPSQPAQAVGDDERGQGQRDQRGDPVADGQAERRLGADLVDRADEHAAGPGDRVLHLAAGGDDVEDLGADRRRRRRRASRTSWR